MSINLARVSVGAKVCHAIVTDKGRITLTNENGCEVGQVERPGIGKFLTGLNRPIKIKEVKDCVTGEPQEGEYKIQVEFRPEEAAVAASRHTDAIRSLFVEHRAEKLRSRSQKMMHTIGLATQYQSTDVPAIEGLRRQPTMYQFQNSLWMEHVEQVLQEIEIETTSSYRLPQAIRDPGLPCGVKADNTWWDPVNKLTVEPSDLRTFRLLGGILLDEAGIGKTMSALMHGYYNNRHDVELPKALADGTYPKPVRHIDSGLVESSATLVVTRNHLVKQWEGEMRDVFRMGADGTREGPVVITIQDGRQWKKLYAQQVIQADFIIISLEFLTGMTNSYNTATFTPRSVGNFIEFRKHNVKRAEEMTITTASPSLHSFHFNRVVFDEIQNLYSTAQGRSLLGTSPATQVHGCARAVNITATHRWGLSASAFNDENDVLSILCILCEQTERQYTYAYYSPLIMHYKDWAGLIFRRNTRETIVKEIPMRRVTRQICRIKPTQAEMKIYNSILAGHDNRTGRGVKDLQMFCACPRLSDETADLQECGSIDDVARNLYLKYEREIAEETASLRDREQALRESLDGWVNCARGARARVTFVDPKTNQRLSEATRYDHVVIPASWAPDDEYVSEVYTTFRNTCRGAQTAVDNTCKKLDTLSRGLRYMKEEVIGAIDREEVTDCPVCCEDFGADRPVNVTKCGHTFCGECIRACINENHICPTCKTPIKSAADIYVISTPEELSDMLKILGSKVSVLVSLLKRTIESSTENVIVFSEWDNLLRYTGNLLNSVGIKTLFMSGNANTKTTVLRKFNDSKEDFRVLMLSSKKSAEGTNLTRATKIIFMDPIYGENRDLVIRQAIGRSMRMNQKSDIEVINLVLEGTVEEEELGKLESGLMDVQIEVDDEIEIKKAPKKMVIKRGRRARR